MIISTLLRPLWFNAAGRNYLLRTFHTSVYNMSSDTASKYKYETLSVANPAEYVYHVEMNRPEKRNAMNKQFWFEIRDCFTKVADDEDCRSIVLSGAGKMFTAGLDLSDFNEVLSIMFGELDGARKANFLRKFIKDYQMSFTALEKCNKPVIAAVHNACVGGGVDLITAADIRYCTQDAWFQIKEVDIGLAADVGTLQRLPKVIGSGSLVRELAYTARRMESDEALKCGLVNRVFPDKESLIHASIDLAKLISEKSPVAVQGTKKNINYSQDHTVDDSLDFVATWNMSMIQTEDIMKAVTSQLSKGEEKPEFSKL